jgi:hypothetical protein
MFGLRGISFLQNASHPISGVQWPELGVDRLPPSDTEIDTVKLTIIPPYAFIAGSLLERGIILKFVPCFRFLAPGPQIMDRVMKITFQGMTNFDIFVCEVRGCSSCVKYRCTCICTAFSWGVAMVTRLDELSSMLPTSIHSYTMVVLFSLNITVQFEP